MTARKIIGYRPIYEGEPGITRAFVLCEECGASISYHGGPIPNALCLSCVQRTPDDVQREVIRKEMVAADILAFDSLAKVVATHAPDVATSLVFPPQWPTGFFAERASHYQSEEARRREDRQRWSPR